MNDVSQTKTALMLSCGAEQKYGVMRATFGKIASKLPQKTLDNGAPMDYYGSVIRWMTQATKETDMANIEFRIGRNSENVAVVRAELGLKWATFGFDGAHLDTGAGRSCEPDAETLATMIEQAPANVARLAAAATSAPVRRSSGSYAAHVSNLRRSPESFAREMDREDSPF